MVNSDAKDFPGKSIVSRDPSQVVHQRLSDSFKKIERLPFSVSCNQFRISRKIPRCIVSSMKDTATVSRGSLDPPLCRVSYSTATLLPSRASKVLLVVQR